MENHHSKDPVLTDTRISDPADDDVLKNNNTVITNSGKVDNDEIFQRLRSDALATEKAEPELSCLLRRTVLSPEATTFEDAVAIAIAHRMEISMGSSPDICPTQLRHSFQSALKSEMLELGYTASEAIREDALAYVRRDSACLSVLEPILFFKGFAATVAHRAAYRKWKSGKARFVAMWLQSQASACFGVDIHPAATMGKGVMIDHANGVVIGETAFVGDGCTILHGVTLGGTGKEKGHDRHPKVGRDVLIGANVQVLGNITIGDGAKIGAGSVVLRPVPHGATAVGSPAKIVGWAKEKKPGEEVDQIMVDVIRAGGSTSNGGMSSAESMVSLVTTEVSTESSDGKRVVSIESIKSDGEESEEQNSSEEGDQFSEEEVRPNDDVFECKDNFDDNAIKLRRASDGRLSLPKHQKPMFQSLRNVTAMRSSVDRDCCSLFRNFKMKISPPGTITYDTLRSLLIKEDATDAEIGEVFFAVLGKSPKPERGYIPAQTFEMEFEKAATEFTTIEPERIKNMAKKVIKKCSRRMGSSRDLFQEETNE